LQVELGVFYFFAAVAVVAAAAVVSLKRAVYSALSLIVCFCALAVLFFQLGAPFIAAVQVIVYAGAIMVLFLFVIMLLDPRSEQFPRTKLKRLTLLALVLTTALVALLSQAFSAFRLSAPGDAAAASEQVGSVATLGRALFRTYLIPFELISILILVAILGAVLLAKRSD
jgi:NADH-quinone oxidoreductase subunit J